jgi:hypothetical protein
LGLKALALSVIELIQNRELTWTLVDILNRMELGPDLQLLGTTFTIPEGLT